MEVKKMKREKKDIIRYQVFVSSTYEDLIEERKQVTQAILECDCFPAGMELFPASNKSQWEMIKQVIDESDVYLVIIAGRYGSIKKGKKLISYTELEFNYAKKINKPIIALIHNNITSLPFEKSEQSEQGQALLRDFINKAKDGRVVKFWNNKDDIKSAVMSALNAQKDDLVTKNCGWIKVGPGIDAASNALIKALKNEAVKSTQDLLIKNDDLTQELLEVKNKNKELTNKLNSSNSTLASLKLENEILRNQENYKDTRDFWDEFAIYLLKPDTCSNDEEWLKAMITELHTLVNKNLIGLFSVFNNRGKWYHFSRKAVKKVQEFSDLTSDKQVSYIESLFISNNAFGGGVDKVVKQNRREKIDDILVFLLFLTYVEESNCKDHYVLTKVTSYKKSLEIMCDEFAFYCYDYCMRNSTELSNESLSNNDDI